MSDQPAKIVTMIDSLLAGGAERLAVETAAALDRDRYTPHVLVTRGDGPLRDVLESANVEYTLLNRRSSMHLRPWRTARRIVAEADLIHSHKFGSNVWAAMLARRTGTPLIVHEHNFSAEATFARRTLDKRWIAPAAKAVLCVSDTVADVERACGVPDHLINVVPNGVRIDAPIDIDAARRELNLDGDDFLFTIGIVAGLRPEKAHEVLLEAVSKLALAGKNVRLCVVGDGPRMGELRKLAATLGIEQRVVWAGERRDAARLASAFDASVICSDWEGLPLAALEAMAAGVPLVASSVGALPKLLRPDAGILVPPRDPEILATAIDKLMSNTSFASAIGHSGQLRVRSGYTFAAMLSSITAIYDDVLAAAAGHPAAAAKQQAAPPASRRIA